MVKLASPGAEEFTRFLVAVRADVDQALKARWDQKIHELKPHGADVTAMAAAARDLTLRGGKRFRAALFIAAYTGLATSASREAAIAGGEALELFQTYLLIQDDWMDGDAMRRGGPSVHAALSGSLGSAHKGAAGAILASDLTWGLALSTLASLDVAKDRSLDVIRQFCRIHEDVVVGQALDVTGRAQDAEAVEAMHALKTGSYTVRGPLVLGAVMAGAGPDVIAALERYAAPLGVAFQLRDDLLGTFGSSEETGKPYAGDLREGKQTAVLAEAKRRLVGEASALVEAVLGNAEATEDALRAAASAIEACGARAAVTARLDALCDEAEGLARGLPIDETSARVLSGAANALRLRAPTPDAAPEPQASPKPHAAPKPDASAKRRRGGR